MSGIKWGVRKKFDPHQAHDFFTRLMREGRADEVNAVHQRAGEKWEAVGDLVRDHARHRGMSSADWARAAFGPPVHDMGTPRLGADPMAMVHAAGTRASPPGQQDLERRRNMVGADDPPRRGPGADVNDPRRSQPGLADHHHQPRRRRRHETPEPRPRVAATGQTFDVGHMLPAHLRPTGFHDLNVKYDEIMQHLMGQEGMSGIGAQQFLRDMEGEMISQAG